MIIRVEQGKGGKDRHVMLSPRSAARLVEGGVHAGLAVGRADKTAYYNVDAITRLGSFA